MSAAAKKSEKAGPAAGSIAGGAELVQALRASGTPDHKLVGARAALRTAWDAKPQRKATAEEVYAALEADPAAGAGTLTKARCLIDTGRTPERVKIDDTRIEDVIAPPAESPAAPAAGG